MSEELQTAGSYSIAGAITFAAIKFAPALRKLIPLVAQLVQVLFGLWEQNEAQIELQARRDRKRRRQDSTQPPLMRGPSKMPTVDAAPVHVEEESTDMVDVREFVRKRSPGIRAPRKGTHHDGEEG